MGESRPTLTPADMALSIWATGSFRKRRSHDRTPIIFFEIFQSRRCSSRLAPNRGAVKVGRRFTLSRASVCWVSRAVQAAIEAMTQIAELSSATGTHAFGSSPWTAADTTGAKQPIVNPICVPIAMPANRTRLLNISVCTHLAQAPYGGPRVRIHLPPAARWYGAGGEEMAPSSLQSN
jgi:hypothetical protein